MKKINVLNLFQFVVIQVLLMLQLRSNYDMTSYVTLPIVLSNYLMHHSSMINASDWETQILANKHEIYLDFLNVKIPFTKTFDVL